MFTNEAKIKELIREVLVESGVIKGELPISIVAMPTSSTISMGDTRYVELVAENHKLKKELAEAKKMIEDQDLSLQDYCNSLQDYSSQEDEMYARAAEVIDLLVRANVLLKTMTWGADND